MTNTVRPSISWSIPFSMRASVRVSMEEVASSRISTERVGHGRAGDGQQLPLALGQIGPVRRDHCLVALGQPADKGIRVGNAWPPVRFPPRLASSLPNRMLSAIVPVKRCVSCSTMPKRAAQIASLRMSRTSMPS